MNKDSNYINIQTGEELDWDRVEALIDNMMLKVCPTTFTEWDFEKNDELGLDVWKMTKATHKRVWWICEKLDCRSNYDCTVANRTNGHTCPYCTGYRVNHTNSLASLRPDLTKEWHPTLNGDLTPHDVTCGKDSKVWWKCELGHEFHMNISQRNKGYNCHYCSNSKILIGFNDMWTTNPELASLLAKPDNGYKYTVKSSTMLDWKCKNCGEAVRNKMISKVNIESPYCLTCSDKSFYPEKVLHSILSQVTDDFFTQKCFEWSNKKRYDFYLPEYNLIIETHGKQHYDGSFESIGGKNLKEEQENDKYKYELALENGIKEYIVIDCRYSELDWIKKSVLNSEIVNMFDLNKIDWRTVACDSTKSAYVDILNLWNSKQTITEIMNLTKYSMQTIIGVLKNFSMVGLCDYGMKKTVYQLDKNNNVIKKWKSLDEIIANTTFQRGQIRRVCNGERKTYKGFVWKYGEKEKENDI